MMAEDVSQTAERVPEVGNAAGGMDESWRQQPGTPVYARDHDAEGVRRALAEASPGRKPEWRGTRQGPGTVESPA